MRGIEHTMEGGKRPTSSNVDREYLNGMDVGGGISWFGDGWLDGFFDPFLTDDLCVSVCRFLFLFPSLAPVSLFFFFDRAHRKTEFLS